MMGLRLEGLLSEQNSCSLDPITKSFQYTLIPFWPDSFLLRLVKGLIFNITIHVILIHSAK